MNYEMLTYRNTHALSFGSSDWNPVIPRSVNITPLRNFLTLGFWRSRRDSNSRTGFTRSGGLANRSLHRLGYSSIWYGNWESNPDCRFRRPMPLSFRLFPRSQKKDNLFNKSLDFRLTPIILLTYSGTEEIRLSIKERPIYFLPQEVSLSILVWDWLPNTFHQSFSKRNQFVFNTNN